MRYSHFIFGSLGAAAMCLSGSAALATIVNVPVVNGSFEVDPITPNTDSNTVPSGWTHFSSESSNNYYQTNGTYEGPKAPGGGDQYILMFGAHTFTGQTSVQFQEGHTYTLGTQVRANTGYGWIRLVGADTAAGTPNSTALSIGYDGSNYHDAAVNAYNGGANNWLSDPPSHPDMVDGWVPLSASYTVNAGGPLIGKYIQPQIDQLGSGWNNYDLVTITDNDNGVPEPTSLALLAFGGAAVWSRNRRKA